MGNTFDDITISIANAKELDELIKKLTAADTGVDKKREAFNKEFESDKVLEKFAGAVASVMYISTLTDIPIDDVLDMYVDEMRNELHTEDTKALMEVGKLINSILDKNEKKGDNYSYY